MSPVTKQPPAQLRHHFQQLLIEKLQVKSDLKIWSSDMESKISAFQVKTTVNDKQTLFESILRNQLYPPK